MIKKHLFIFSVLLLSCNHNTQTAFKGKGYEGYIVHCKEDDVCVPVNPEDIAKIETALQRDTALINKYGIGLFKDSPADTLFLRKELEKKKFVIQHLSEYKHQYIASINLFTNDKVIDIKGVLDS